MALTENHKAALAAYLADAKPKVAAIPERVKVEAENAAREQRQPFEIMPLTEVKPSLMALALAECKDTTDPAMNETIGTLRRVCSSQNQPFAMKSEQLIAVLTLAGIE